MLLVGLLPLSNAQSPRAACESLGRDGIDCECVAVRVKTYQNATQNADIRAMLGAAYIHSLGMDSDYPQRLEKLYQNPDFPFIQADIFEPLGG